MITRTAAAINIRIFRKLTCCHTGNNPQKKDICPGFHKPGRYLLFSHPEKITPGASPEFLPGSSGGNGSSVLSPGCSPVF